VKGKIEKNMTKHKSKHLAMLVLALLFAFGLSAQSINFNYTDGTNAVYNLQDVRKVTFDQDEMNLHLWDGSIYAWNVSTIGYYKYDETTVNMQELLSDANTWQAIVFPNPVNNILQVQFNLPKEDGIKIALYDMQGKIIVEKNMGKQSSGLHLEMLDLSNLPAGSYVCIIAGKFNSIKKRVIKQ
jgi:hypothetical protein